MTLVGFFLFLSCWWSTIFTAVYVVAWGGAKFLVRMARHRAAARRAREDFPRARQVRVGYDVAPQCLASFVIGLELGVMILIWVWTFLQFAF